MFVVRATWYLARYIFCPQGTCHRLRGYMDSIRIRRTASLLLLATILFSLTSSTFIQYASAQAEQDALRGQFELALRNLDTNRIQDNVKFFSGLSSRVTGYPGFFDSVDYIVSKLREYRHPTLWR